MLLSDLVPMEMTERLAIAALIGLAVGTEREWSSPPSGPGRRFAGLRTFLLFGLIGGVAGLLIAMTAYLPAAILLAAGTGFTITAYAMAVRRPEQPLDGTTETAAFVVLSLATLAGLGELALAVGAGAVVVFALGEKQRLHWLVGRIGQVEMHAALEFLVLALVVLPLLPAGPFGDFWAFRPRALWSIVLVLSGINFVGYLARRGVGPGRGYGVTGALGGLVSSTVLTLQFSRLSRTEPQYARGLSLGTLAACTVLPVRLLAISLALNASVAWELLYYVVPATAIGAAFTLAALRSSASVESPAPEPRNPLRLWTALQLAVVLQLAFTVIGFARSAWGASGLIGSSVVFGLADLDALAASMNRLATDASLDAVAARGIAIGMLTNTIVKLVIATTVGERTYKRRTFGGLAASALGLALLIWWRW